MSDILELYKFAEQQRIGVYWFTMEQTESLSYMDADGSCYIAMDPWRMTTLSDEKVKLGHELGHCQTGSFYSPYAARDVRQKHENRANIWAIKRLVPESELWDKVGHGYTESWELAEQFGVTQEFMEHAMRYYQELMLAGL